MNSERNVNVVNVKSSVDLITFFLNQLNLIPLTNIYRFLRTKPGSESVALNLHY